MIKETNFVRVKRKIEKKSLGIYIHLPFCKSKCLYCDFYSMPAKKRSSYFKYARALVRQMREHRGAASAYYVDSIFIGGGTPTCMPRLLLFWILLSVRLTFRVAHGAEVTVEINPDVPRGYIRALRLMGINRISMGVQSADDEILKTIGRRHVFADCKKAVSQIKKAGFRNFNLDVMYGLPGQTTEGFLRSLGEIIALEPTHVSLYGLKLEEGTPLCDHRGDYRFPDEETEREMYFSAIAALGEAGYAQYEISNFAKAGFRCRHNMKYWNMDEYLGLGCAAASYFGGVRFTYAGNIDAFFRVYIEKKQAGIIGEYFEVPPRESMGDYIMLRLRLTDGVDFLEYKRRFFRDFEKEYGQKCRRYIQAGLMEPTVGGLRLTTDGFYVSNRILADIVDWNDEPPQL